MIGLAFLCPSTFGGRFVVDFGGRFVVDFGGRFVVDFPADSFASVYKECLVFFLREILLKICGEYVLAERLSVIGIHNLRTVLTVHVTILRFKFEGIRTDIFVHNHIASK